MGNVACIGRDAPAILSKAPTADAKQPTYTAYSGPPPRFTCMKDGVIPPRAAAEGAASLGQCEPTTLPKLLKQAVKLKASTVVFAVERDPATGLAPAVVEGRAPPALPFEEWKQWTYTDFERDATNAAKGMIALGFQQYDTVNIWGFNSPEWIMSAVAASIAGGKAGGIYPTDTPDTVAFKVVHSGGSIIVLEDEDKIGKLQKGADARGDAKRIKAFVVWGSKPKKESVAIKGCGTVPVLSWDDLLKMGADKVTDEKLAEATGKVQPGNCAALIYTSGTTGDPKAVMISHDNIIYEAKVVQDCIMGSVGKEPEGSNERIVSYLPMSHVAGMMVDVVTPIVSAAMMGSGCTVYFARPYDLKVGTIKDRLQVARPTMFLGVPLVWEKIADKIKAIGAEATGLKKSVATYAKDLGVTHARACQIGGTGATPAMYGLVEGVVLKAIKANLGLQDCKYAFTGAAPIRVDTLEYYGSLGIQINEVYGMSECTGACTWSVKEAHEWGSCGWEMPGQQVRAFIVDDKNINTKKKVDLAPGLDCTDEKFMGELCFSGRNVMMGYLANPDLGDAHVAEIKKKTAEAIDDDGFLHSGDKGLITTRGMVKITGRYKELIIGEGGENIAPVPIEDHVKKSCEGIAEVMMVGDKRKYNVALITLKAKGANGEVPGTDDLDAGATRVNPDCQTISGAINDQKWIETVTAAVKSANDNTKICPNNTFKIQKFCILPTNFSEENNELTPTKKLKRKNVETRYAELIDRMYKTDGTYIKYAA